MVNTITLSSDMNTLYLIDDERAIPFDLTSGNGVLIGTLLGQVTVATAIVDPKGTAGSSAAKNDKEQTIELKNSQWTVTFNSENQLLHVVGETEIDFYISTGSGPQTKQATFDLKTRIISLKKVGSTIVINSVKPNSKSI